MQNQDAQKVDSLISQILEILRNPEVDLERKPNNIHLEISSKSALWGGLVEIHQNVSVAEGSISPSLVNQISDCVEEAISNAVRHGKASVISIYLQEGTLGRLVLTVTDNGQLDSTPVGGFGFRIYQEASQGNWSVKRDKASDLTMLEVNFIS
jgi:signal transduction histidine kinase